MTETVVNSTTTGNIKVSTELRHSHDVPTSVFGVDLIANRATMIAACMDGVWSVDVDSGEHRKIGEHHSYASGAVASVSTGQLVTAGYDGALQWYGLNSLQLERRERIHKFWSWQLALSPDGHAVASVTGQYLAGGYKYEPRGEVEPSVRVVSVATGKILHSLPHVPSVQAVAFSPDGQFLAAANLMGEVRVWDMADGELVAKWTTPDFTSWGIIKSHCYIGGIHALQFAPDGEAVLVAGMGPMRDPMAGNGRQLWQKFSWREGQAKKLSETRKDESGEGLMEALAVHPSGDFFVMAGRLRGGDWNAGFFDLNSGRLVHSLKTGYRITEALFSQDGRQVYFAGTKKQPRNKDGNFPAFGRIEAFEVKVG